MKKQIIISIIYYFLTTIVVMLGSVLGETLIYEANYEKSIFQSERDVYANWDGQWYKKILLTGYSYDPNAQSSVAFFPIYPLAGRAVARLTRLKPSSALVLTSNVCFIITLVLVYQYIEKKQNTDVSVPWHADFTLLALGLVPTSFFFRMAYSESLFLLVGILFLNAVERKRPLLLIALIVGLATACRPVGFGLMLPLLDHIWSRATNVRNFLKKCTYLLPISCSGILGYMIYLRLKFGEPLAFVKTQTHWSLRRPVSVVDKFVSLTTFEPIRRLFDPSLETHWDNFEPAVFSLLSLHVFDYGFFVAAIALIVIGVHRHWLSRTEWIASTSLLFIPYCASAYEVDMRSMGRYTSVVIPIYLVLGRILAIMPPPIAAALLTFSGFLMGIYAAMFSSGYKFL